MEKYLPKNPYITIGTGVLFLALTRFMIDHNDYRIGFWTFLSLFLGVAISFIGLRALLREKRNKN